MEAQLSMQHTSSANSRFALRDESVRHGKCAANGQHLTEPLLCFIVVRVDNMIVVLPMLLLLLLLCSIAGFALAGVAGIAFLSCVENLF